MVRQEQVEPVELLVQAEPVVLVVLVEQAEQVEPAEQAEQVEPAEQAGLVELVERVEPVEQVELVLAAVPLPIVTTCPHLQCAQTAACPAPAVNPAGAACAHGPLSPALSRIWCQNRWQKKCQVPLFLYWCPNWPLKDDIVEQHAPDEDIDCSTGRPED